MNEYVRLYSNTSSNLLQHENSVFNFFTVLNPPLEANEKTEVGLVQLIYPKLYYKDSVTFLIYSDIVSHTYCGSKQYQILRQVQLKNSEDDFLVNYESFENPYYIPLCNKHITTIQILLEPVRPIEENYFLLAPGNISLTLHFKDRETVEI